MMGDGYDFKDMFKFTVKGGGYIKFSKTNVLINGASR